MDLGFTVGAPGYANPAAVSWPHAETFFHAMGWMFGIVFWLEIVFRLFGHGLHFFTRVWVWLDMFIAIAWTLSEIGTSMPVNPQILRLARLTRLMRFLKLVRQLKGFDALQDITTAVQACVHALLWASLVMLFVLAAFALLINQVLHEAYFEEAVADPNPAVVQVFL